MMTPEDKGTRLRCRCSCEVTGGLAWRRRWGTRPGVGGRRTWCPRAAAAKKKGRFGCVDKVAGRRYYFCADGYVCLGAWMRGPGG